MPTTININDPMVWGVEAHGVRLHINAPIQPSCKFPWVIDVENNQDGTCAGIGIINDGEDIFFFTQISNMNFFADARLVGHNVKYDVQMLRKWGFNVSPDQIVWDTQVAEYVRNSTTNKYGLKDLAKARYGAAYPTYKELCGTGKKAISIGELPVNTVANYNGCDVLFTHKLLVDQFKELDPNEVRYINEIELPTLRVLLEMEERGVRIDGPYMQKLDAELLVKIQDITAKIQKVAGSVVNLNSHQQLKKLFSAKYKLHLKSTAADILEKHSHIPLVADILRYRQLKKLQGTYTHTLAAEGTSYRLHARFNQTVTHTGRLSSSDLNLQNIPTRTAEGDAIRKGFIADEGSVLLDADFSQIEPRLMAHFSEDPMLLDIFLKNEDLYDGVTAALGLEVTKENRKLSKTLWLAMSYNAGAYKISKTAGISVGQAQDFLDKMRGVFSQFFYWKDKMIKKTEIDGGIRTLFGRFIPLPLEWAHLGPNYLVQGSAGEINKLALCATRQYKPLISVHDEGLYESQDITELGHIKAAMEDIIQLKVPMVVECGSGPNWSAAKS